MLRPLPRRSAAKDVLSADEGRIIKALAEGKRPERSAAGLGLEHQAMHMRITRLRWRFQAKTTVHLVALYTTGKIRTAEPEVA